MLHKRIAKITSAEAKAIFRYGTESTIHTYFNAISESLKNNTDSNISLSHVPQALIMLYLGFSNASLQQITLEKLVETRSKLIDQVLTKFTLAFIQPALSCFGAFIRLEKAQYEQLVKVIQQDLKDQAEWRLVYSQAIVIGMRMDEKPVTRDTFGFHDAITSIEELQTAINANPGFVKQVAYLLPYYNTLASMLQENQSNSSTCNT